MRIFRFALRPDLAGPVWIILVRQDEVHSLCWLAFVPNSDFEFVSSLSFSGKRNDQFLRRRFKLGGVFVDRHSVNGESSRVENDFRGTIAKNRE